MAWYHFSKIPAANASADPMQNWAESQAPSSLNDSARALLAVSANYRDDTAGGIVTTGTAQNYILQTFSNFTTTAFMANQLFAFTAHATNTGSPVTMSVDSAAANIPLRSAPNQELQPGALIQGSSYCAVFNQADNALYLQSFYGASPFLIPLGGMIDYFGSTAPSNYAFPIGQQISITAYASLYTLFGPNKYGADTSSLFFLPDVRGRVVAGFDAGNSTGRLNISVNAAVLGSAGGEQSHTLAASEIPAIGVNVGVSGTLSGVTTSNVNTGISSENTGGGGFAFLIPTGQAQVGVSVSGSMAGSGSSTNTGGAAHNNIPPTIIANKLLRIA
jgi:microcystin-dependent protein